MMEDAQGSEQRGWLDASGLPHLLRIILISLQPSKLGLALAAIIATFVLGWALDFAWTRTGGIGTNAIELFIKARQPIPAAEVAIGALGTAAMDRPPAERESQPEYVEPPGEYGPFYVWREHSRRCVLGLLGSSIPGADVAEGTALGSYVAAHARMQPLRNLAALFQGVWWLIAQHTVYFVLFGVGSLLIWSFFGGAVCRLAAVHFARDEKLTWQQGTTFSCDRLMSGFFLAPCIPLGIIAVIMLLMSLWGLLLLIPLVGDLLGGIGFAVALFGGFAVFVLLLGLIVGGNLFWPAVAAEGADAFDAFSRGVSYPLTHPLRATWYAVVSVVLAAVAWVFVNLSTYYSLQITRAVVGFGTTPFGWGQRQIGEQSFSKMEALWPLGGPNSLYQWPAHGGLGMFEYISAFFVGLYVAIVIGLMWAFLASFYYSACTVVYFLLRRDVDGADLEDVFLADELDEKGAPLVREPARSGISLPVMGKAEGHST